MHAIYCCAAAAYIKAVIILLCMCLISLIIIICLSLRRVSRKKFPKKLQLQKTLNITTLRDLEVKLSAFE